MQDPGAHWPRLFRHYPGTIGPGPGMNYNMFDSHRVPALDGNGLPINGMLERKHRARPI